MGHCAVTKINPDMENLEKFNAPASQAILSSLLRNGYARFEEIKGLPSRESEAKAFALCRELRADGYKAHALIIPDDSELGTYEVIYVLRRRSDIVEGK